MVNWAAIAAVAAIVGALATMILVPYAAGQFTNRLKVNEEAVDRQDNTLIEHRKLIEDHDLRVDRLEQWRNGFNAAANVSGTPRTD